jgi:hypothetical protein
MSIYITVCEDRHTDDDIQVFQSLEAANARLQKFMNDYDQDYYQWVEEDWGRPKWVRYVHAHVDGPKARIEKAELQ